MTQLILVVDFKLLRGFGLLIYFAYGRLIFIFVFVVTIVAIVFGTRCWRWDDAFGGNLSDSLAIGRFMAYGRIQPRSIRPQRK